MHSARTWTWNQYVSCFIQPFIHPLADDTWKWFVTPKEPPAAENVQNCLYQNL